MENAALERARAHVEFDRTQVVRAELGPGPLGTRVRCTVPLAGPVDERWRRTFRSVQLEDTGFFRFRLEMGSNHISFTVTETERGREVPSELRTLQFLLDTVNGKVNTLKGTPQT
ncbi:MAG: hypothetical protein ABI592_05815 [Acidobacteriota bacterium]